MPYITQGQRETIAVIGLAGASAGDLNYVITQKVLEFLGPLPTYGLFNAAIGALECAKLELYRRMVTPYEDRKIEENGDVYPY